MRRENYKKQAMQKNHYGRKILYTSQDTKWPLLCGANEDRTEVSEIKNDGGQILLYP